jgi:group I intron endonuclease
MKDKFQAYLVICLPSGRKYIGITSCSIRRRWNQHLSSARNRTYNGALLAAITKYGAENFTIEHLCSARSWEDLCTVESILIEQWGTLAPSGYNLCTGGDGRYGFKPSRESIEKSAAKHRGKPCHPNTRAAAIRTHKGKPKSVEMRAKLSASKLGIPRSAEVKRKLSDYWDARRKAGEFTTSVPYAHARKAKQ